ncbi:MAG: 2-C-methyl-D-erythritol 4-phosphate cytidylyltransferase [Candidatus Xenobia bacterium]
MKAWAIVTAAGRSRRFGQANKLLAPLRGRPVLAWTLEKFEWCHDLIEGVIVTAPAEDVETYRKLLAETCPRTGREVVSGGLERQQSIYNALRGLSLDPETPVAVHDGARPLLHPGVLFRLLANWEGYGVVLGQPVTDTIKRVEHDVVLETLDRETLVAVQTPQIFPFGTLLAAHEAAARDGFVGTDDASLIERMGGTVRIVKDDPCNIKITTEVDLWLAEKLLERWSEIERGFDGGI